MLLKKKENVEQNKEAIKYLKMSALEIYKKQLPEDVLISKELIEKTVQQLNKDFGTIQASIEFNGAVYEAYNIIFRQIYLIVKNLIENNFSILIRLLYTIDVHEKTAGNSLKNHEDRAANLTDLILRREVEKVLTREYFSQMQKEQNNKSENQHDNEKFLRS